MERDKSTQVKILKYFISTHTLTWSVTKWHKKKRICTFISTHTLTWSVTPLYQFISSLWKFQLTRSRGAWQVHCSNPTCLSHFNSHAHVERDLSSLGIGFRYNHFNSHAHVERDLSTYPNCPWAEAFQLTRSRGAWPVLQVPHYWTNWFQLTRSRGAWQIKY